MSSDTLDPLAKTLLSLQRERCSVASAWRHHFTDLLHGKLSAEAYTTYTQQHTIPQMSKISAEFIALRDAEATPKPYRTLAARLQEGEKAIFQLTLSLQQKTIQHLTARQGGESSSSEREGALHHPDCEVVRKCNVTFYKPRVAQSARQYEEDLSRAGSGGMVGGRNSSHLSAAWWDEGSSDESGDSSGDGDETPHAEPSATTEEATQSSNTLATDSTGSSASLTPCPALNEELLELRRQLQSQEAVVNELTGELLYGLEERL